MKRILIFSLAYHPRFVGGAEVAIKEITDRIPNEEFSFDMVTLRFDSTLPKKEKIGNVTVHRIGFTLKNPEIKDLIHFPLKLNKYIFPVIGFLKARKLHKENYYDAVWGMMAYTSFAALFFKFAFPCVSYLLTLQEGDPLEDVKRKMFFVYPLFKRVFLRADFIQTISTYLSHFARDMGYTGTVRVVPNGVDTEKFEKSVVGEKRDELRSILGIKDDQKMLITTSRLVKKNALDDVIVALTHLPSHIKFIIVGAGPEHDSLVEMAKYYKISDRVVFVGYVAHALLPEYLQIADVFIRTPHSEGMGNSFVEAMAAGIPVIATPVGGIVDFITHKETGLFADTGNPQSIAAQVEVLLHDDALRMRLIKKAKILVREKYDWNLIAVEMKKIFTSLC